jgi:hypothetical protein
MNTFVLVCLFTFSKFKLQCLVHPCQQSKIYNITDPNLRFFCNIRFRQIEPKIIFSVEAVSYNLKKHDHLGKLKEVVEGLPKLEKVIQNVPRGNTVFQL